MLVAVAVVVVVVRTYGYCDWVIEVGVCWWRLLLVIIVITCCRVNAYIRLRSQGNGLCLDCRRVDIVGDRHSREGEERREVLGSYG